MEKDTFKVTNNFKGKTSAEITASVTKIMEIIINRAIENGMLKV